MRGENCGIKDVRFVFSPLPAADKVDNKNDTHDSLKQTNEKNETSTKQ